VAQDEAIAARVRAIYAVERLYRLLDDSDHPAALHELPEETLRAVVTCVNAIADVVERRLTSESDPETNDCDAWDAPSLATR